MDVSCVFMIEAINFRFQVLVVGYIKLDQLGYGIFILCSERDMLDIFFFEKSIRKNFFTFGWRNLKCIIY